MADPIAARLLWPFRTMGSGPRNARRGVQVDLDRHQRVRAREQWGLRDHPRRSLGGLDEAANRHHALKANCVRRHLSRQQGRDPRPSNRAPTGVSGFDADTVGSVLAGGEIPRLGAPEGRRLAAARPQGRRALGILGPDPAAVALAAGSAGSMTRPEGSEARHPAQAG